MGKIKVRFTCRGACRSSPELYSSRKPLGQSEVCGLLTHPGIAKTVALVTVSGQYRVTYIAHSVKSYRSRLSELTQISFRAVYIISTNLA